MSEEFKNDRANDNDDALRAVRDAFGDGEFPGLKAQLLQSLREFSHDLAEHPYVQKLNRQAKARQHAPWRLSLRKLGLAVALAAGGVALATVLAVQFFPVAVTWAAVAEKFRSVASFNAVIYQKSHGLATPLEYEIWYGRQGMVRIRYGSQVVFGNQGRVLKAFDVKERKVVEPDPDVVSIIGTLGEGTDFSIKTVLRTLRVDNLVDATPEVNAEAVISEDLVVFDLPKRSRQWIRIWALRESRLPVRVRFWDPSDGESTDCFFTYSKEQPKEFWDPERFAAELAKRNGVTTNVAYALLKDPGRRPITNADIPGRQHWSPEEVVSRYHMPTVESVQVMDDGAIWVVAANARNRMPNGDMFSGFAEIGDDLGRTYYRVYSSWHISDTSTQLFLPEDYPFDERQPNSVTLTCKEVTLFHRPGEMPVKREVEVGSVRVDRLDSSAPSPNGVSDLYPRVLLAQDFFLKGSNLQRVERILRTIQGDPAESREAFWRDRLRVELLVRRKEFAPAAELARSVGPLLLKDYRTWAPRTRSRQCGLRDFIFCLAAFAGAGRIDEARALFLKVEDSPMPDPPADLGGRLQANYRHRIRQDFEANFGIFACQLLGYAGITVKQLGDILETDVLSDPRLGDYRGSFQAMVKRGK